MEGISADGLQSILATTGDGVLPAVRELVQASYHSDSLIVVDSAAGN